MFSRALIATDLSEACDQMVRCAKGLRALGTDEIVLIQCFNLRDVGTLAPRLMELSQPALDRQAGMLYDEGFAVSAEMVLGLPQIEIGYQAERHGCGFIVVGSHGQTMSREMLLGSVASGVMHAARMPVLLVRLKLVPQGNRAVCVERECDFLAHVLFPTDFSENAACAYRYVRELAVRGAKRVTLLHVQDKVKLAGQLQARLEEFNRVDTERLTRLQAELLTLGAAEVRIELPYGSPKQEIVRRTEDDDISLVVMGSQGRGYLSGLFLGGVSDAVARHAATPVLVVPMSAQVCR